MPRYVALLRGINLGRRRVSMDTLRAQVAALGFTEVATFIASGNVVFQSPARDGQRVAAQLAAHLESTLGYPVDTFVRTRAELAAVARYTPFPEDEVSEAHHTIHCGFLHAPLPAAQAQALTACRSDRDAFHVHGREYYWLYRGLRTSESTIWASPAIKAVRLPSATLRKLTTVRKLAALYPPE